MEDHEIRRVYQNTGSPTTGAVIVPALQALITGGLCGAAAGILALVFPVKFSAFAAAGVVWILATLAAWLSYRGRWQRVLELVMGVDLNGSGGIGDDPQPPADPAPAPPLRVEVIENGGQATSFIDLPYSDRLPALASGLLSGRRQFAQTAWCGAGQLFSRAEFDTLRGEFLRRGLARWKNPQAPAQGVELTPAGRAVLRKLAGQDDSPTPTLPGGR